MRAVGEPGERFWTPTLPICMHLDKSLIFSNQMSVTARTQGCCEALCSQGACL